MPVFVLTTGTVLAVTGYGYTDSRITYSLVGGGTGVGVGLGPGSWKDDVTWIDVPATFAVTEPFTPTRVAG